MLQGRISEKWFIDLNVIPKTINHLRETNSLLPCVSQEFLDLTPIRLRLSAIYKFIIHKRTNL